MVIARRMTPDPVTIGPKATILEAIELMKANSIRHLPVVERDGQLVGWLSDGDVRASLMPSMIGELRVEDIMIKQPFTLTPSDTLEVAAALIAKHKIGGFPVVEGGKLVGVLTVVDILRAFIDILGVLRSSSRLDVELRDCGVSFQDVSRIIRDQGAEVISVGILQEGADERIYSFRLEKCDIERVRRALEASGYRVLTASP